MAKMTSSNFVAAMIVALLAYRQKHDADAELASTDKTLNRVDKPEDEDTDAPTEQEAQDWFQDFSGNLDLDAALKHAPNNIKVIATLKKGEPAFTLRGQDILSSPMVRLWAAIASLNEDVPHSKIDQAEGIAERMEEYEPQKWPD